MDNNTIPDDLMKKITEDRVIRRGITKQSHLMFFLTYFPHYVKHPVAEFHKDIFRITEDQSNTLACIVAFRGSGKSTLVTFSYSLWSILGVQEKKFVLIICQTQAQAKQHMSNLKSELDNNTLLKGDLGPFHEDFNSNVQWAISSLVFENTRARIMVASIDQSIRGMRHHEHRPDLIILDDIEDINSTKTMEGRNKTFDWFTREVIPLGDIGTRIIVVGNLLHEDSLMMRLKRKITDKEMPGVYFWFPLINTDGKCLWPGKFNSQEKIEDLKQSIGTPLAWRQEYMLEIISDSSRVIHPEWIQFYDQLPAGRPRKVLVGIDLAISTKESADYTAMVAIAIYGSGSNIRGYVLPDPFNERITYPEFIYHIREIIGSFKKAGFPSPEFVVESNGFQEIYVSTMSNIGCEVKGVKHLNDKRSRLAIVGSFIENATILFPKEGCEDLILQLTGFGRENHDDISDSFGMAVFEIMEEISDGRPFEAWLSFCEHNGGPWI